MKKAVLAFVAMTLAANLPQAQAATPAAQEKPPVARITGGDALVEEKGRFKGTWVHPDADITRYSKLFLWDVVFQFRDVGKKKSVGTTSSILRSTRIEEYPVAQESREKFKQVVVDAFVKELQHSKKFQVVDEVSRGTLIVRGAVLDIVSRVPPSTARVDVYLATVGEGTIVFELIDPETGLMQARVGDRRNIRPPIHTYDVFSRPANFNVWVDVEQWARGVASDLRRELEKRQRRAEKNR